MLTRIFALTLALLTITAAPAHANFIRNLDADVNLNFGPSEQLTGEMPINVIPPTAFGPFPHPFFLTADFSLNGTPLTQLGLPLEAGFPGTLGWFTPTTGRGAGSLLLDLTVNTANLGTITVLSETFDTPLPAALPLFGSGVLALAGFAWRSRGKVSGP